MDNWQIVVFVILLLYSGFAKAVMDIVSNRPNFDRSIFKDRDPEYWLKNLSDDKKYKDIDGDGEGDYEAGRKKMLWGLVNVPVAFTDAWHHYQFRFLNCLFLAWVFYSPVFKFFQFDFPYIWISTGLNGFVDFLWARSVFGLSFVLFYDYVLRKND